MRLSKLLKDEKNEIYLKQYILYYINMNYYDDDEVFTFKKKGPKKKGPKKVTVKKVKTFEEIKKERDEFEEKKRIEKEAKQLLITEKNKSSNIDVNNAMKSDLNILSDDFSDSVLLNYDKSLNNVLSLDDKIIKDKGKKDIKEDFVDSEFDFM